MKRKLQYFVFLLALVPSIAIAGPIKRWDHEKSKTINKEFEVNADASFAEMRWSVL